MRANASSLGRVGKTLHAHIYAAFAEQAFKYSRAR